MWALIRQFKKDHEPMVLILDGISEMGAHVRSNLCYFICLRHEIRSRAVTNLSYFSPKRPIFLHACATCFELGKPQKNKFILLVVPYYYDAKLRHGQSGKKDRN